MCVGKLIFLKSTENSNYSSIIGYNVLKQVWKTLFNNKNSTIICPAFILHLKQPTKSAHRQNNRFSRHRPLYSTSTCSHSGVFLTAKYLRISTYIRRLGIFIFIHIVAWVEESVKLMQWNSIKFRYNNTLLRYRTVYDVRYDNQLTAVHIWWNVHNHEVKCYLENFKSKNYGWWNAIENYAYSLNKDDDKKEITPLVWFKKKKKKNVYICFRCKYILYILLIAGRICGIYLV